MFKQGMESFSNVALARETMITQLAARADLLTAAIPRQTLGGYGETVLGARKRQVVIDARLSMQEEFVSMARVRVEEDEERFHEIAVTLGEHSLLAKVYDQDGHIITDWPTTLSLAVLMRRARAHL